MSIQTRLKPVSGPLDLTPLVDVLFLLLIFFMLSSSLVFQPGIPVTLPRARVTGVTAAEKIVVTITNTDQSAELLFFNDKPVDWDELERELSELVYSSRMTTAKRVSGSAGADQGELERQRSPLIVLRADTRVPYGRIVEVMALARSLNLGVYLATDVPERERAAFQISPQDLNE